MENKFDEKELRYATLAPTNKAAIHIEGSTIHKFLGLDDDGKLNSQMLKKLKQLDYVIVDEISMVGYNLLHLLHLAKLQSEKVKFIFVGDYRQLEPVAEGGFDYENSTVTKTLCDNNKLVLTINKRSDDTMTTISDYAYDHGYINKHIFGKFELSECIKHLCFTNKKRIEINENIMSKQTGNILEILCSEEDLKKNEYAQDVILVKGTPIMSCKNVKKEGIVNNQDFIVQAWVNIYIKDDYDDIKLIRIDEFQTRFVVAYAMTVHKSQGQTFNFKFAIHEYHKMNNNMLYTALTRTTNKDNILIVSNEELITNTSDYTNEFIQRKINGYTTQDKNKYRTCDLDIEYVRDLVIKEDNTCFNCACKLNNKIFTIDRLNNDFGHIKGNCRLACWLCNIRKREL